MTALSCIDTRRASNVELSRVGLAQFAGMSARPFGSRATRALPLAPSEGHRLVRRQRHAVQIALHITPRAEESDIGDLVPRVTPRIPYHGKSIRLSRARWKILGEDEIA